MVDKYVYSTVFSQIFSPCGNYLVSGNNYGEIAVFNLQKILNPLDTAVRTRKQKPFRKFRIVTYVQICSFASTDDYLIVGTRGTLCGYDWESVISSRSLKLCWQIEVPPIRDVLESAEVNTIAVENGVVYAGCGDNSIHMYSLDDGRKLGSLNGHSNYIHDIKFKDENELISAGEDGFVYLWDLRTKKISMKLEPHKNSQLARPELGKWVGAVDVEKDWLLCGGGPKPSIWHLRSEQVTTVFDSGKKGVHAVKLFEDRALIGGVRCLDQFTLQGDMICSIPCSSSSIYSLALQDKPHHVLCMAGASPYIDVCTNFNYKDMILTTRG